MLDGFAFIGLLFAGAGRLTFAYYEIFLIPEFLKTLEIGSSLRKRAKSIFIIYHLVWCGNNSCTSTKCRTSCIYQYINYVWIYFLGSNYKIIRLAWEVLEGGSCDIDDPECEASGSWITNYFMYLIKTAFIESYSAWEIISKSNLFSWVRTIFASRVTTKSSF